MLVKSLTGAAWASALMVTTAMAQATAPAAGTSTVAPVTAAAPSSFDGNWRTSKVVGLNVYNDGNESLGAINDLLTDKSGKIVAVVVGVGGFLGVGERYVAIPFDKVKFVTEPVATSASNAGGELPGARPAPNATPATTTGAATGATVPMATPAAPKANPWYPDHAVISTTKDELKAMPEFKYSTT